MSVSVVLTKIRGRLGSKVATSTRDIREFQASLACELAYTALSLTGEPDLGHAEAVRRSAELVELLEVTTTALLISKGESWQRLAKELGGVTRQSFHRRLSGKVAALRDGDPTYISLNPAPRSFADSYRRRHIPKLEWVKHLKRLQEDMAAIAETGNHPAIVKHRRKVAKPQGPEQITRFTETGNDPLREHQPCEPDRGG